MRYTERPFAVSVLLIAAMRERWLGRVVDRSGLNRSFAGRVARLATELASDGVVVADMRRAQALELQLAGMIEPSARIAARQPGIEPVEGPIESRSVASLPPPASRIRYFLDGTQRTLPVWRCGVVPIVATIAAAAVLARDKEGNCSLLPGTLRMEHAWLIPELPDQSQVLRLRQRIEATGGRTVNTLSPRSPDATDARNDNSFPADYGHLIELAYAAARRVREELERQLLQEWSTDLGRSTDDGWIVVDGRLRTPAPNALGLVKQFSDAYLTGGDAETLLNLGPGQRTTAFFPTDRYRGGPDPDARTLWYLRLWDATGLDARHALVRVEAGPEIRQTAQIDEISGWLLAERLPRATADARWATLLYPIHLLERILKRRLEADTCGWPTS